MARKSTSQAIALVRGGQLNSPAHTSARNVFPLKLIFLTEPHQESDKVPGYKFNGDVGRPAVEANRWSFRRPSLPREYWWLSVSCCFFQPSRIGGGRPGSLLLAVHLSHKSSSQYQPAWTFVFSVAPRCWNWVR
jgi:hypothetical protein